MYKTLVYTLVNGNT